MRGPPKPWLEAEVAELVEQGGESLPSGGSSGAQSMDSQLPLTSVNL